MAEHTSHPVLGVECPACPEHDVPFEIIATSRQLLDELGVCVGPASYECPALYFASLAPAFMFGRVVSDAELARWEDDGGTVLDASYGARQVSPARHIADQ